MKWMISAAVFATVLGAGVAVAQQQSPPQPGPTPGHHQHMHGGMCPMMGGMGGGMMGGMMGAMGMMGGQSDSPRVLQMRGEMMKAMGEIMMKYGKAMEGR